MIEITVSDNRSVNNSLTPDERAFLKLIQRSPDVGDGWRHVSKMLWRFVRDFPRQELLEHEAFSDGAGRVRFSERGYVLAGYL